MNEFEFIDWHMFPDVEFSVNREKFSGYEIADRELFIPLRRVISPMRFELERKIPIMYARGIKRSGKK